MFRGVFLLLMLIAVGDYLFMGGVYLDTARRIASSVMHFFSAG
jgi:hypothetical protein